MTTETETETYEELIGTAMLNPDQKSDSLRRIECKLQASARITCDCGNILDQKTVTLIRVDRKTAGAMCPACFPSRLGTSLAHAIGTADEKAVRRNFVSGISAADWNRTYTGAQLWEMIANPAPSPKRVNKYLTPQQLKSQAVAYTAGIIVTDTLILIPNVDGRKKLGPHFPGTECDTPRQRSVLATSRGLLDVKPGERLTPAEIRPRCYDDRIEDQTFRTESGAYVAEVNAQLIRTAERYCGAGHWHSAPSDPMNSLRYCDDSGNVLAIVASLTDEKRR